MLGSMLVAAACLGSQTARSSLASNDTARENVVVTELENGSSIEISKGAVLTIRLETVPGTGYAWTLVRSDTTRLRLLREDLEIAGGSKPGSAAHKIFQFVSEQSGPSTVELHYVRGWEQDVSPKKKYRIGVYAK
jgi:predicted secreted protein